MGADLKRKEARKRKFGGKNSESLLLDAGVKLDLERTSADEPPKKKLKQAPPPPPSFSDNIITIENIAAGKVAVVDESTDQGQEETLAAQKAQRFIVFIGQSTLFKYGWLGRLTTLSFTRQSTLHRNG